MSSDPKGKKRARTSSPTPESFPWQSILSDSESSDYVPKTPGPSTLSRLAARAEQKIRKLLKKNRDLVESLDLLKGDIQELRIENAGLAADDKLLRRRLEQAESDRDSYKAALDRFVKTDYVLRRTVRELENRVFENGNSRPGGRGCTPSSSGSNRLENGGHQD